MRKSSSMRVALAATLSGAIIAGSGGVLLLWCQVPRVRGRHIVLYA